MPHPHVLEFSEAALQGLQQSPISSKGMVPPNDVPLTVTGFLCRFS